MPRRRVDKLARYTDTTLVALATLANDVPYWCTLTPTEKSGRRFARERGHFFRRNAAKRKRLRDFIRSLCR